MKQILSLFLPTPRHKVGQVLGVAFANQLLRNINTLHWAFSRIQWEEIYNLYNLWNNRSLKEQPLDVYILTQGNDSSSQASFALHWHQWSSAVLSNVEEVQILSSQNPAQGVTRRQGTAVHYKSELRVELELRSNRLGCHVRITVNWTRNKDTTTDINTNTIRQENQYMFRCQINR